MKITNNTRDTLDFIVSGKAKNGVPPTDFVEAGETKDIDVDVNDPVVQGRIRSGAISVPERIAEKVDAMTAADPVPLPKGK